MASFKLGKTKYGFLKTATSGGTLTLVASSKQFQIFTGTTAHIMKLPDATTTSNGSGISFTVINQSTGIITVQLNDASVLTTVAAGSSIDILLTDHSTSNGTWKISSFSSASGGGIGSQTPGSTISSNYNVVSGDLGRVLNVDTSAARVITLPAPSANFIVTIKDATGYANENNINIQRNGSELIDGSANGIVIDQSFSAISLISNGTNWFRVSNFRKGPYQEVGLFAGGFTGSNSNVIDYVLFSTTANAIDFGDLTVARRYSAGCASAVRALFGGGTEASESNIIDYVTIATLGNAIDFGDLTTLRHNTSGCSNATRGLFAGGILTVTDSDVIDYVTIATLGNATDFGDLTVARRGLRACSSLTRGLFGGGVVVAMQNVIDYVEIATTANAIDFGDLTVARRDLASCSSSVRGLWAGGSTGAVSNVIDYVTIATTGNATDFGDLTVSREGVNGCSNKIFGLFGGGNSNSNVIDYVSISTLSNALDFGDLTVGREGTASCSNAHGGI